MSGIWGDANLTALTVLGAASASVGAAGLLGRLLDPERGRRLANMAATAGLVVFAIVMAAIGRSWPIWLPAAIVALVCALCLVWQIPAVQGAFRRAVSWSLKSSLHAIFLVVGGAALSIWALMTPGEPPRPVTENPLPETWKALEALRPIASPIARTDKGRRVGLFALKNFVVPAETLNIMESAMASERGLNLQMIRCSPPDADSDCHGWVFVDAQWWIIGEDVQLILDDNGYQQVAAPQPGDLVVYRDGPKLITHSGVVFSAAPDGSVLIESKWAWLGTYLHPPEANPYGGQPVYYRSERMGHRLDMRSHDDEPVRAVDKPRKGRRFTSEIGE